ncbi:MAG: hypothetical protein JNJ57_01645 [Saprospiraceae bacterium]|nr:hypothetical protein [Saprospiraceae bacterium]
MNHDYQEYDNSPDYWLKRTLKDHRPEVPNNAWDRLEPFLPQKKRRRLWPFWMIGFAAVVLCLLTAIPVMIRSSTSTIPDRVHANGNPILQKSGIEQEKPIVAPPVIVPASQVPSDMKTNSDQSIRAAQTQPPSIPVSMNSQNGAWAHPEKNDEKPVPPPTVDIALLTPSPPSLLTTEFSSLNIIPQLPAIPLVNSIDVLPRKAPRSKYFINLEAAPILVLQKMKHHLTTGDGAGKTYAHAGTGWQSGVFVGISPFRNWKIAVGLQYERQGFEVMHSNTFRIKDGVCLNPNATGLKEYEFNYQIASGAQTSNYTLRLQQQHLDATMADDEPFNVDMRTKHFTQTWRIPFVVERQFKAGKWTGFIRGGATIDVGSKTSIQVAHYNEVCEALCFQTGIEPLVASSAKSAISVGWLTGAGLERPILPHLALRVQPFIQGNSSSYNLGLGLHLLITH